MTFSTPPAARRTLPATLLATLLALLLGAGATLAQDPAPAGDDASDPLGEVTLFGEEEFTIQAATKTELPISKAPGAVTVIGNAQIRESGARTIPELLRLVAGVNVRWNPMVQSLDMRSFGQNPFTSRVLLLIDGVPYNSWNKGGFPQHPGFDFFMLQSIKRIEIVRGPGSSLYGENAYWGVVNIVTLSGEDLQGGRVELYGGDLEHAAGTIVYGDRGEAGSLLVSARAYNGQLPVAFWFDEPTDSETSGTDVFVKGKRGGFEASYYRHEDELDGFSTPGFIPGSVFRSAPTIEQTVDIAALKYNRAWDARGITFGGDLSYAQRDGSRCAACHAAPQNPAFSETIDHGSQLIGDFRVGLQMIPSHDILLGVEARRVDTGDHTDELLSPDETTSDVVYDYAKVAAYAQDQISFLADRFRLTVGARFDGSNDLFDSEVSPRIAGVYTPNDKLVLRGGWSTAFRFPVFSELYQDTAFLALDFGTFARPLQVFEPNPELQPEEIRTFELGGEYRFGPAVTAKLDLFYSELKDFIVIAFRPPAVPVGPTRMRSENHPGEASILGSELELRIRPGQRFNAIFNWAWQENEREDDHVDTSGQVIELLYSPEHKLNLGAYFGPFGGFRGALEAQWRDRRIGPEFWSNVGGGGGNQVLEDYTLLNARLSWDAPLRLGRSAEALRLSVYGKNLLDEEYRETLLPIDMHLPGTTYYGSVELRF